MPAPRLSQSVETARAAAQQAEFNEKKWVWVPDAKEGYLAGWVNREEEEVAEVVMAASAEIRRVPFDALFKMNPPKFDRVEDIADLTFLNEASVVHNLRLRYGSGAIYTYSGLFLVAINPYQSLPLYSDGIIQQYRNKRREENPPHIFAVAERAWINMGEERENQSILITGESGAGKTESTKKVIQYLAAIATDAHLPTTPSHSRSPTLGGANTYTIPQSTGSKGIAVRRGHAPAHSISANNTQTTSRSRLGLLERQILQANPILEAFGNAQTQRNNNSSRFGKFVRISFAPDGSIAGANIDWYLLEKSRVVFRNEAERNFHVFYQLLAGADKTLRDKLLLDREIEDYEYLNKSRREVDGVDDREEWGALLSALDTVGFAPNEQFDLFRIAAAVLHIGNIAIVSTRADDAIMPDPSRAERVCHLLGLPVPDFIRAVLSPRVLAGREMVTQARTKQQALDELAALCKTLYEKSFGSLVEHINRALDRPSSKSTFIGVLDIAGFEIFETNSYEQLLINYTNEKLQQFFNHHMFVLEQEEYAREGIKWDYVNFGLDLQPTIELIETSGNAIGILSCLDEECIMPKATDITFTNKLHGMWAGHTTEGESHPGRYKYEPSRFEMGFIIQHYAGRVEYRTDGWLEKNKDPLNDNLSRVLAASSERYVASLFAEYGDTPPARASMLGKKRILKKGAFRTVGQRHKEQLSSLMSQLQATQPHFVRCIVPNMHKKPGRIDVPLVLDQLRCNGVLEGIRIARLGYPNRLPFVEFRQRYEILTPGIIPRGYMDGREACRRMVHALELDETVFKIGTSKIFFKAGVLAELEERRDFLLFNVFSRVQATARKFTARRQMKKILNRAIAVRTIQRNARVYGELREWPWWQLYTKVRPLLAATRSDEELRKKEAELALIRERAERDKQEKDALENLNMSLEAEKRKIEDELEAERVLGLDKDALLDRSKKREVELEEEVAALQADLDLLDSQLDRAMKLQKEGEEKHEILRRAFDEAAEHLVRLETEQKESASRENELTEQLGVGNEEIDALRGDVEELRKVGEELKNLVQQREEDLVRSKERSELMAKELEGKLDVEARNRELFKDKLDNLETEARRAKEQSTEMVRTANRYSTMIKEKEEQIAELVKESDNLKSQREMTRKEILELQSDIDTLTSELETEKGSRAKDKESRLRLQEELDELRSLMEAKTSEETRRNDVERSREEELSDLRFQVNKLTEDLADARLQAVEGQSKLKLELEYSMKEHVSLQKSFQSLVEKERATQGQLSKTQATLTDLEKINRASDSELQALRIRQHEYDDQLQEATRQKEVLERQLTMAQTKYHDFEDVVLQFQRDKESHQRQLEAVKRQLEGENTKRLQLEKNLSTQRVELTKLKDLNVKLERDLHKALKDVKDKEWELKQAESKRDRAIVEHKHVYEAAKKMTDAQLAEAQLELQKNAAYIRSLEKAKARLLSEAEDLTRETERERAKLRTKQKLAQEAEGEAHHKVAIAKIRELVERQHAEIRQLVMDSGGADVSFQSRLLRELQSADDALAKEMSSFSFKLRQSDVHNSPSCPTNAVSPKFSVKTEVTEDYQISRPPAADNHSYLLMSQIQALEIKMAASERVRHHLETAVRDITAELENNDGSKQFIRQYQSRLSRDNARLAELLEEEAQARRAAETAQLDGVQSMWTKFQNTIEEERDNYARLEESRKTLLIQQRTAQADLEVHRGQARELAQAKKQLQLEVAELRQALDLSRNEAADAKKELQRELQKDELSSTASSAVQSELRVVINTYKTKEREYQERIEAAEMARAKAARGEAFVRRTLTELETAQVDALSERKALQERLKASEQKFKELQAKLEGHRESSEVNGLRQQLAEQLEDERTQHQKDMAERDFTTDQTRKKYQAELAQLSEELQSQRDNISRLREDNRKLRSDYDELQLRFDDEVYNSGGWKKEKERMEMKIADLTKAYEASTAAQTEQQSQIVALHSQARELRSVLDEAEADRALLQKARRALQAELETIKLDHVDSNKLSTDQEFQRLQLKKLDLERSLEEQEDRVASAYERMKKAEAYASECQVELGKVRVENSELEKLNANLEKQLKELNVRIVDLETKSYANTPRSTISARRVDSKIEELTHSLTEMSGRRSSKSPEKSRVQLLETERQRIKLEERKTFEAQIQTLRQTVDKMQTDETGLQAAKRRAEREALDYKQKTLNLERELERMHARLERPVTPRK